MQPEQQGSRDDAARSAAWRWLPLAGVVLALGGGYALGLHRYLTFEKIAGYQAELSTFVAQNPKLASISYVAVYAGAVGLSFPGASVLTAAGGAMFGCKLGTTLAALAASLGATIIFLIARTSLGALMAERAGPMMQRLRQGFADDAFNWLLFLRLAPIFPFWAVNLAAALFGMRLGPYVLATAIGILPGTFVLSYLGENLDASLDGSGPVLSPGLIAALALLAAMALVPVGVRRYRAGKAAAATVRKR